MREYRDSDTLLKLLGGSFADGFDDYFCHVKASFPDLDLSHVSIDTQDQTPTQPIYFEGTNELFADETILTLKVTRMLLKLTKKNSSRMLPIILKGIRLWRRRPKRPLPFSRSFFFFTCKLLAFDLLRELYPFLPLTLDVNFCLFVGFYSLSLFIRH